MAAVHSVATRRMGIQHGAISGPWRGCYHTLLWGFHTQRHEHAQQLKHTNTGGKHSHTLMDTHAHIQVIDKIKETPT